MEIRNFGHVICEVTDAGSPPLTRCQRIVVEVK
ncbi:MAG: hypothetical protein AB8B91_13060 [Rubripirellula sp.]